MNSNYRIGIEYEHQALRLLHEFGALTIQQIAALLYAQGSLHEQARLVGSMYQNNHLRLAQRLVARMKEKGLVLTHRRPEQSTMVAVAEKGARLLRSEYSIPAKSGKDIIHDVSGHREAANWAAVYGIRQQITVYTEREIQTYNAPLHKWGTGHLAKVPDCLWHYKTTMKVGQGDLPPPGVRFAAWIEVENCRRGGRDLDKLAQWIKCDVFMGDEGLPHLVSMRDPSTGEICNLRLYEIVFWLSSQRAATFPTRLAAALKKYGVSYDQMTFIQMIEWPSLEISYLHNFF